MPRGIFGYPKAEKEFPVFIDLYTSRRASLTSSLKIVVLGRFYG